MVNDLKARFDANTYLSKLDEKARREALKGHKTPFTQDEFIEKMGEDKDVFRFHYRFFSQHTHTSPVSFIRMIEHDRGAGVETESEKRYMMVAINFAHSILDRAVNGQLLLFPEAETRKPFLTDKEVARNVERNQGRLKPKS
ncbi:DUF5677 domain-containing protein [Rhizobium sp. Leaf371]|uniref:DUF5677 domain-containing protein n=1 Tax=Rhizobium sp. Leaf371 TaxID=1736355 RepID=UPI0012E8956D